MFCFLSYHQVLCSCSDKGILKILKLVPVDSKLVGVLLSPNNNNKQVELAKNPRVNKYLLLSHPELVKDEQEVSRWNTGTSFRILEATDSRMLPQLNIVYLFGFSDDAIIVFFFLFSTLLRIYDSLLQLLLTIQYFAQHPLSNNSLVVQAVKGVAKYQVRGVAKYQVVSVFPSCLCGGEKQKKVIMKERFWGKAVLICLFQ